MRRWWSRPHDSSTTTTTRRKHHVAKTGSESQRSLHPGKIRSSAQPALRLARHAKVKTNCARDAEDNVAPIRRCGSSDDTLTSCLGQRRNHDPKVGKGANYVLHAGAAPWPSSGKPQIKRRAEINAVACRNSVQDIRAPGLKPAEIQAAGAGQEASRGAQERGKSKTALGRLHALLH